MGEYWFLTYGLASLAVLYLVATFTKTRRPELDRIPSVGFSGPLTSYFGVLQFLFGAHEMTIEGYRKHREGLFKIANKQNWTVFCCNPSYIDDIRKAREDELSIFDAGKDKYQISYTFGIEIITDPYHFAVIHPAHSRSIPACVGYIQDEVTQSFSDHICPLGGEWLAISPAATVPKMIAQIVNRVFVGLPLCRDPDYLDMNACYAHDIFKVATVINIFPNFLRPLIGNYLTKIPAYVERASKHLGPMFDQRMQEEASYGKDSPRESELLFDMLLDAAPEKRRNLRDVCLRTLFMNYAAIITTSMAFTHVLYHLAADPQYVLPLREEVESIVSEEGWTKKALDRMIKIDSFIRETQRVNGLGISMLWRKALQDFAFSDGTVVPAGCLLAIPTYAIHHNEDYFPHPELFDPFRFSRMAEHEPENPKHQMTALSYEFGPWGTGKWACPGRFLAAAVMKTMLAHLVITYDVKLKKEGARPHNHWIYGVCLPNRFAKVLFRRCVEQT